jgi:hypothetical protein
MRLDTFRIRMALIGALCVSIVSSAVPTAAQSIAPAHPPVKMPGPTLPSPPPTIGGPGIGPGTFQQLSPAPSVSSPALPSAAAPPAAIFAAPTPVPSAEPAAPARVVRFRCEVAPQSEVCREPALAEAGGGGGEECSCARDYCHVTETGTRICEKQ